MNALMKTAYHKHVIEARLAGKERMEQDPHDKWGTRVGAVIGGAGVGLLTPGTATLKGITGALSVGGMLLGAKIGTSERLRRHNEQLRRLRDVPDDRVREMLKNKEYGYW